MLTTPPTTRSTRRRPDGNSPGSPAPTLRTARIAPARRVTRRPADHGSPLVAGLADHHPADHLTHRPADHRKATGIGPRAPRSLDRTRGDRPGLVGSSPSTHPTAARRHHRLVDDHGSSLLLVPAGVLIVFVLAGMAVDLSGVHLAQRELLDAAASAANDAAGAGIDTAALRADGRVRLDADRVRTAVDRSLAAQRVRGLLPAETQVSVDSATATVTVRAARRTSRVFAPALPGSDRSTVVRATASATATTR